MCAAAAAAAAKNRLENVRKRLGTIFVVVFGEQTKIAPPPPFGVWSIGQLHHFSTIHSFFFYYYY